MYQLTSPNRITCQKIGVQADVELTWEIHVYQEGYTILGKKPQHFNSYRKKNKTKSKKNVKWDFRRFKHGLSAWSLKLWLETIIQITWICIHDSDQLLWMGWGHQDTPKALPQPSPGTKGVQSMHLLIYSDTVTPYDLPLNPIPKWEVPNSVWGSQKEHTLLTPAPSFSRGKRAELFVYLREKEKKMQTPTLLSLKRLPRDSWVIFVQTQTIRSVLEGVSSTQHGKFSPQIIKIWSREKQLKTGLTQECAIKITAGLLPALSGVINFRATENAGSAFFFFPFFLFFKQRARHRQCENSRAVPHHTNTSTEHKDP